MGSSAHIPAAFGFAAAFWGLLLCMLPVFLLVFGIILVKKKPERKKGGIALICISFAVILLWLVSAAVILLAWMRMQ